MTGKKSATLKPCGKARRLVERGQDLWAQREDLADFARAVREGGWKG